MSIKNPLSVQRFYRIRLIVTDLDNTLLRRDKTISDYTLSVLERLRERGIMIAFATARYFRTVEGWMIPAIGFRPDVLISLNGAYAYENGRLLYRAAFTPEIGNRLVAALRKAGGMVTAGTDTIRYCERAIDDTHKSFSINCNFDNPISEFFHYVDVRGVDSAALDKIAGDFPTLRVQRYSDSELVTFLRIDARKELALTAVLKQLHVLPDDTIALGDDRNDLEMLRMCGVKAAVSNAIAECKAIADDICGDCDEDGVARWLEEHLLCSGW